LADKIDAQLERLRKYLTGLDPDAVNANTVINYAANTYKGAADLLRVGRGFGNYYYGRPCTVPADELFKDIGRASSIALLLAGPAAELSGYLRAATQESGAAAAPATGGSVTAGSGGPALDAVPPPAPLVQALVFWVRQMDRPYRYLKGQQDQCRFQMETVLLMLEVRGEMG
jgi:hypothetical protein